MTRKTSKNALILLFAALLSLGLACERKEPAPEPAPSEPAPAPDPREAPASAAQKAPPPSAPEALPELDPKLLDPAAANEEAPAEFAVELATTKGAIVIDVTRAWSPRGADRFYNMVKLGYFTDVAFFRVIEGFMAQGGIHGDPRVNRAWRQARIDDDPPEQSNTRGMVSFAMAGPNTRTTQFFISFSDENARLDEMGFSPFGRVRDMAPVDALYSGYGEGAPQGRGPMQGRVQAQGNSYLKADFPELDYIQSARIL